MGISFWNLLLILMIVFVVFGAGKLPSVMKDMGRGLRSLKEGMNDNSAETAVKSEEVESKE